MGPIVPPSLHAGLKRGSQNSDGSAMLGFGRSIRFRILHWWFILSCHAMSFQALDSHYIFILMRTWSS